MKRVYFIKPVGMAGHISFLSSVCGSATMTEAAGESILGGGGLAE